MPEGKSKFLNNHQGELNTSINLQSKTLQIFQEQ